MNTGEKRNFIRMDSLHLLDYLVIDKEGQQTTYSMGRTLDVSAHGLKLEVTKEVAIGDTLMVTVGLEDDLIDITGEVKFSTQTSNRFITGIEFSEINEEGTRILLRYIAAFKKHTPIAP